MSELPTDPSALRRVEEVASKFDADWKAGCPDPIERYAEQVSEADRPVLVYRLVRVEVLNRRARGQHVCPADYKIRFPGVDFARLEEEIDETRMGESLRTRPASLNESARGAGATVVRQLLCCPHCRCPLPASPQHAGELVCHDCGGSFRIQEDADVSTADAPAGMLGRFRLLDRVGHGSFGTVWRAYDTELHRTVALKVPHPSLIASADYRERILREARAAAQLRHPGIAHLYEVASVRDASILVSDFIQGVPLRDYIRSRQLTFREAAWLVAGVADALDSAHARGLVHRDIKPANIMMEFETSPSDDPEAGRSPSIGKPIIVDFGLALRDEAEIVMTLEGAIIGTPAYMSPEQAAGHGHRVDRRSDVYSLGVVLYELICAELPFRGSKAMMIHQVLHEEPRAPRRLNDKIPRDLETICLTAMAKEPSRRYASAAAMAADLRSFLKGEPIKARPLGRTQRAWRWCRRNPAIAFLLGALAVIVPGGTGASLYYAIRASIGERNALALTYRLKEEKARSDRRWYDSEINLADNDWRDARIGSLLERLNGLTPEGQEADLRRFEWGFLRRLSQLDLRTMVGHRGPVWAVAMDPTERLLASGGEDGTVRVWNIAQGSEVHVFLEHTGRVGCLDFAPGGRRLASGGSDGTVRLWDAIAGGQGETLARLPDAVVSVAFSPDGRRFAAATGGNDTQGRSLPGKVWCWDVVARRQCLVLPFQSKGFSSIAFSPDGKSLAIAAEDKNISVWDTLTGKKYFSMRSPTFSPRCVAFHPDGRHLATGHNDAVRVWETGRDREVLVLRGHAAPVESVAFSPDGHRLVSASADRTVRLWDLAAGIEVLTLRGHSEAVHGVVFSRQGRVVASASADGTLKIWDAGSVEDSLRLGSARHTGAVEINADGQLASANELGVAIWNPVTGEHIGSYSAEHKSPEAIAFDATGSLLAAACSDGFVRVWQCATHREILKFRAHEDTASAVCFNPAGTRIATGSATGHVIKVWDTGNSSQIFSLLGHSGGICSLRWSPDGRLLASASQDKTVRIWDAESGVVVNTFDGHTAKVLDVDFQPGGRLVASASMDRTVMLWDAFSGKLIATLPEHLLGAKAVRFSSDGRRLATSDWRGTVKIWDVDAAHELIALPQQPAPVFGLAFSRDGLRLVTACVNGTVRIWDASPLTDDLREYREARSVLQFLRAKHLNSQQITEALRADPTISEPVRRKCIALVAR
jgi:WD40 repeat protein/serine/threonine protein kinase